MQPRAGDDRDRPVSHQEWLLATRTTSGPSLQTGFPTYGRLLRQFGYQTPYFGKWHLSDPPADGRTAGYLEEYGFRGMTNPDPVGTNGQGADDDFSLIAATAARWLAQKARGAAPFCITVSFVNPHDKQFFWAGSEGGRYEGLFSGQSLKPFVQSYQSIPSEESPRGWGSRRSRRTGSATRTCPSTASQTPSRCSGPSRRPWAGPDHPSVSGFSVAPSPIAPRTYGVGISPFSYWQRGLDMYTLVQQMVDQAIGETIAAIPKSVLSNTVIVFASDHGEYAGAHGMLSGKIGSAYEEAIHVPLIVTDLTGRFARRVDKPRRRLASSVDVAPMLVTLGNRGSVSWRRGQLRQVYGERLNLVELLANPNSAGRDHILFSTDEIVPVVFNYLHAPTHVLAVRTQAAKLVTYTHWYPGTTRPIPASLRLEYYDYGTPEGRAETQSQPDDPRAKAMAHKLFTQYVPQQMEAPLPPPSRARWEGLAQATSDSKRSSMC